MSKNVKKILPATVVTGRIIKFEEKIIV